MTEVKIPLAELFWSRWSEGWGDGVPYSKLSAKQRGEIEAAAEVVAQAVREELGAGPARRVTAVLDVNGAVGLVTVPGDTWAAPIIPGDLVIGLGEKETARFKAGKWLGVALSGPATDAALLALIEDDEKPDDDEYRLTAAGHARAEAEAAAMRDLYREALERLADEDTPVLGEGLGGGPQEELHVRASFAAHTLGRDTCGCTECQVSLGLDDDPEDAARDEDDFAPADCPGGC